MPRHVSSAFAEFNFALSKINGSYVALCLVCGRYLKNTAAKRVMAHRNICKEDVKSADTEEGSTSDLTSSSTVNHNLISHPGEPLSKTMRIRGDVWKYFTYDVETKHVTCKYCDKKYKRNATRMQEHLKGCTNFQESGEKTNFSIRHREKKRESIRFLEHFKKEDSADEDNASFESQLISVEPTFNSAVSNKFYSYPVKRKRNLENSVNLSSFISEEKRDEFDTFGEHVANELRKLKQNAILLANTKHELHEVLHKAVMESLKNEEYVSVVVENISAS